VFALDHPLPRFYDIPVSSRTGTRGIVRKTEQFRAAEAEEKLTRLPTGDGMVLVSRTPPTLLHLLFIGKRLDALYLKCSQMSPKNNDGV
jgi:hypothetical protein